MQYNNVMHTNIFRKTKFPPNACLGDIVDTTGHKSLSSLRVWLKRREKIIDRANLS